MYPTPHSAMACAVFSGSSSSGGGGVCDVFTAQNRHPLVHVSPSNITVAVPVSPFQHSPTFGHIASSHTVFSFNPPKESFRYSNRSPLGARCRNHGGFFGPGGSPFIPPLSSVVASPTVSNPTLVGPHIAAAARTAFGSLFFGSSTTTPFFAAMATSSPNASADSSLARSRASASDSSVDAARRTETPRRANRDEGEDENERDPARRARASPRAPSSASSSAS